jgi:uncharacterized protein
LPNLLKLFRDRKGISQAELARQVKVSRQALNAVETNKQDPSLPLALKIAHILDLPLQQIFFAEDENMERTKTAALTKAERLAFVNQYKLLQGVHSDDEHLVKHYRRMEEIFARGYVQMYREAFSELSTELSAEVSEEVLSILDMHRAILFSLGQTPNPEDIERVKFQGFDANDEGEHLGFAKFFTGDGEKYQELRVFNSHHSTLPRYRKMLAEWERMGRKEQLIKPQIESILEVGISNREK